MKPSEELLELRERCVEVGWERESLACAITALRLKAWSLLDAQIGSWMHQQDKTFWHGWPRAWVRHCARTHLEVIELIERAAVAAMREEQGV